MLGLEFGDQVPAFEKLFQFLQRKNTFLYEPYQSFKIFRDSADREVELLRLLLVGPSFGQARFAQIGLTKCGLDRLHAVAMVKAFGHVVVLHCHHILDGAQSGLHCFLDLINGEF